MSVSGAYQLSRKGVLRFHDEGYLGPFRICPPEQMAVSCDRIEREVLTTDGPNKNSRLHARHLDCRVVFDLCTSAAILDRVASVLGADLVLWSSNFFNKNPGDGESPWHQDINYWPIDPPVNVSAWIAIDDVTVENSCVRLIPGSHRKLVPHVLTASESLFAGLGEKADPAFVDASKAINMELKPGEFFLFSERLLHQSEPNRSNKRRMGLSIRLTVPFVKIYHGQPPLFPGHKVIVVRGEDKLGLNESAPPPVD